MTSEKNRGPDRPPRADTPAETVLKPYEAPAAEGSAMVSVVIPARDCAEVLPGCLAAIAAQSYSGPLEVIVALAEGSDSEIVLAASADAAVPLRLVDNPVGTTPAGLNAAIRVSRGRVIARVDAQARIPPHYLARAVETLQRTGAANAGGLQRPVPGLEPAARVTHGDGFAAEAPTGVTMPASRTRSDASETARLTLDRPPGAKRRARFDRAAPQEGLARRGRAAAIAAAVGSSFGGGPAAFRTGAREGPTDTVYLGVFRRDALDAVGGYDESLLRNQDYELNWRLREAGFTVWLDPALAVDYVARSSYRALAGQYFAYGAWKRVVLSRHPRSLRLRQLAAPALCAALCLSACDLLRRRWRGLALPLAYVTACVTAAARLRSALPAVRDRVRAGVAFAVMHLCWGAGFLTGRTRRPTNL